MTTNQHVNLTAAFIHSKQVTKPSMNSKMDIWHDTQIEQFDVEIKSS